MTDEIAKMAPNRRACPSVAAYLRNAKLAPLRTISSSARSIGTMRVDIAAAKVSGNAVHQVTRV